MFDLREGSLFMKGVVAEMFDLREGSLFLKGVVKKWGRAMIAKFSLPMFLQYSEIQCPISHRGEI